MSRTHLLGAVSAAALACFANVAFAQSANTITGGGSTLAEFDYFNEFAIYNASVNPASAATFSNPDAEVGNTQHALYWPSGSGSGQSAFLNNNLSIDANKVDSQIPLGAAGGVNAVSYGASDATLSTTQISAWNSSAVGELAAGHLIQLPSMGTGVSFPVVNAKVTANGATSTHKAVAGGVILTDNDLCGIFSGKIVNWSATSAASSLTPGAITVVYRSDGSGTSFLLLNHLSAVCNTTNSNFLPNTASGAVAGSVSVNVSTTFANAGFLINGVAAATGTVPSNFLGESGSGGIANYLSGQGTAPPTGFAFPPTSAISYLTPDFTTVDPNSNAVLANGAKSALVVAAVRNGLPYIPTVVDVTNALNHVSSGQFTTPPTTAAAGALPQNYVPLIQTVSVGYPVVGYTTFDFAQCYQNRNVAIGIIAFLQGHYAAGNAYATSVNNNGFVNITKTSAKVFAPVISGAILGNSKKWNDNIQNQVACASLAGR
jgi:phosphate transport system substrate-binding protein